MILTHDTLIKIKSADRNYHLYKTAISEIKS